MNDSDDQVAPVRRAHSNRMSLVAEPIVMRPGPDVLFGDGTVTLTSSPFDPLGEVPVVEIVTCAHGSYDNTMLPGKVVGRVWNLLAFAKYAFFKVDVAPVKLGYVETPEETGARG